MGIRIEKSSIVVTPTSDPNVVRVDADVTKDAASVENPTMEHVSVLWNITTSKNVLKDAIKSAMKDNTFQDNLRDSIGETVRPVDTPSTPTSTTVIINADSVTVNQTTETTK